MAKRAIEVVENPISKEVVNSSAEIIRSLHDKMLNFSRDDASDLLMMVMAGMASDAVRAGVSCAEWTKFAENIFISAEEAEKFIGKKGGVA